MSANIIGIFLRIARERPNAFAIIEGTNRITYATLASDVQRVAGYLRSHGIERGDHVLVFVPMSARLYTLMLALFHIGAAAVFIDAWADRKRLALACRAVALKAFIGIPKAHFLRVVSKEIRNIPMHFLASIERWRSSETHEPVNVGADDAALITFTTGSSGAPKGAVRTHGFLVAQHRALVASLDTSAGDVDLPVLPIFALNNLAAGATTVIPALDPRKVDEFNPAEIVAQMLREGVTTTTGSPSFYRRLAEHCNEAQVELPSLRQVCLGGAPVGPALARLLVDAFPDASVTVVYGSTEAEPISLIAAPDMLASVATGGSGLPVGKPIELIDLIIVSIVDGPIVVASGEELHGMALGAGECGEICVAGDHVLSAYHGDAGAWARTKIHAGGRVWHRTGDGGYIDDRGALWLMGSVRQSFMHGGRRVFVLPVELLLAEIDGIASGTIMRLGERVVVALEVQSTVARADIERRVREQLADIDEVRMFDELPRDPRHRSKINYELLREMMGDGH